jgi:23S rRNA pseudouridine2604 synthase
MSFRRRIKYYLVHTLNYTGKGANKLIASGTLSINGKIVLQNEILKDEDEVKSGEEVVKARVSYRYYALNKPVGIESTFNKNIKDNLSTLFPFDDRYSVAGRLDKASEGLLLISDDGKWIKEITKPENKKEKEYEVEVDKNIDEHFVKSMSGGLDIGICVTQPCRVKKTGDKTFNIILTEGKNKQIRRMCKKLGLSVLRLQRIRVDKFYLSDLQLDVMELTNI